MALISERLKEIGYELPEAPKPVATYIPALKVGNFVFTSGVLPMKDGALAYVKEVGGIVNSVEYGYEAAKQCTLNALSIVNDLVGIDNIERVIKVTGFVNSATGFTKQPQVINGASDLLGEVFGENGKHVRSAIGVSELPLDASVEVEFVFQVKE